MVIIASIYIVLTKSHALFYVLYIYINSFNLIMPDKGSHIIIFISYIEEMGHGKVTTVQGHTPGKG